MVWNLIERTTKKQNRCSAVRDLKKGFDQGWLDFESNPDFIQTHRNPIQSRRWILEVGLNWIEFCLDIFFWIGLRFVWIGLDWIFSGFFFWIGLDWIEFLDFFFFLDWIGLNLSDFFFLDYFFWIGLDWVLSGIFFLGWVGLDLIEFCLDLFCLDWIGLIFFSGFFFWIGLNLDFKSRFG